MDLFYEYDIERLRCYASITKNSEKISIESNSSRLFLAFADVGYFNYCVCHEPSQLPQIAEEAKAFYTHQQIDRHKLLIDEALVGEDHVQCITERGYQLKERLVAVHDPALTPRPQPPQMSLQLAPVCVDTISEFTKDYLAAFESEQKNITPVVDNFRQLLTNKNITLFRVTAQMEPVGIAVLFGKERNFCLAGGAILPAFRNRGYHTTAIVTRLNWLNEQNAQSIISWAYNSSPSYHNMLKVGLAPYKIYRVYER